MRVIDALEQTVRHATAIAQIGPLRSEDAIAAMTRWGFYRQDVLAHFTATHDDPEATATARLIGLLAHCAYCTHALHPYRLTLADAAYAGLVRKIYRRNQPGHAVSPSVMTDGDALRDDAGQKIAAPPWETIFGSYFSLCVGLFGEEPPEGLILDALGPVDLSMCSFMVAGPEGACRMARDALSARGCAPLFDRPLWPGANTGIVYRPAASRAPA